MQMVYWCVKTHACEEYQYHINTACTPLGHAHLSQGTQFHMHIDMSTVTSKLPAPVVTILPSWRVPLKTV